MIFQIYWFFLVFPFRKSYQKRESFPNSEMYLPLPNNQKKYLGKILNKNFSSGKFEKIKWDLSIFLNTNDKRSFIYLAKFNPGTTLLWWKIWKNKRYKCFNVLLIDCLAEIFEVWDLWTFFWNQFPKSINSDIL